MRAALLRWTEGSDWAGEGVDAAQLALCFASPEAIEAGCLASLAERCRRIGATLVACSTGGEICGEEVTDGQAAAALLSFDSTKVSIARRQAGDDSSLVGEALGGELASEDLRCVFILSDGLHVNGTRLVEGLRRALGDEIVIAGGLAGDGARFGRTLVGLDGTVAEGEVVAVGLSGSALAVRASSHGGWDAFGPERRITKASGSVLYELDGRPALALYKTYLGDEAARLPSSALLFPLAIRRDGDDRETLVRTIVGVDEEAQSLTFAGEMPEGWSAQLMRGAINRIVSGAAAAAAAANIDETTPQFGLLVSCIGRKLMLGQRVQEEVEAVFAEWPGVPTLGFYSYGEIGPHGVTEVCTLHNQTMTALLLSEH